jgi:hypothetical protein
MLSYALERDHGPRATGLGTCVGGGISGGVQMGSLCSPLTATLRQAEDLGLNEHEISLSARYPVRAVMPSILSTRSYLTLSPKFLFFDV